MKKMNIIVATIMGLFLSSCGKPTADSYFKTKVDHTDDGEVVLIMKSKAGTMIAVYKEDGKRIQYTFDSDKYNEEKRRISIYAKRGTVDIAQKQEDNAFLVTCQINLETGNVITHYEDDCSESDVADATALREDYIKMLETINKTDIELSNYVDELAKKELAK